MKTTQEKLQTLFKEYTGEHASTIDKLPEHGSERKYFRLINSNISIIGTYNPSIRENKAFLEFSKTFKKHKLNVPEIFTSSKDNQFYLQQDLGDTTLFSLIAKNKRPGRFAQDVIDMYKHVVRQLPYFQIIGGTHINFDTCYPRHVFDRRSMVWDLNYFKYYFVKLVSIQFDEQALENDFKQFTDFLLKADRHYFMYRDFQSRNVMIHNLKPYFIDYQGGRKGALQYDIASLLFDSKADIPKEIRGELLEYYLESLEKITPIDRSIFKQFYPGFILIRILQAMGAYGYRGFYEQKTHFLQSVPYAIQNLEWLLQHVPLPIELPELMRVLQAIVQSTYLRQYGTPSLALTVRIMSFSYKKGTPRDEKGHGGGYTFDTRSLPNPHRVERLRDLPGTHPQVVKYLEASNEADAYIDHVKKILSYSVENYRNRNFTDLLVTFGCTGGQHRSVYCAEKIATFLRNEHHVEVEVFHRDLPLS